MLSNLETRLNYRGGKRQYNRMVADKLWSLKSAINNAYQTVTIETPTEQQFYCLLNPSKLEMDYNCSILSVPYEDINLVTQQKEKVELNNGDIFTWVEDGSKWILVLHCIDEVAYYRAKCKKCEGVMEIGDGYPIYIRGPQETKIDWFVSNNNILNNLNYSLLVYITKNEETLDFLHRHKEVKIDGLPYEVQAINGYGGDGIIEVALLEYYKATVAEEGAAVEPVPEPQVTAIEGKQEVEPYAIEEYSIDYSGNGHWTIDNNKASIIEQTSTNATVEVKTGKSGKFILAYIDNDEVIDTVEVTITSL